MVCRRRRLRLGVTSSHVEDRRSKRVELTGGVRSERGDVEYVEGHGSARACGGKSFGRSLTRVLYGISSPSIVEGFVVSSVRGGSSCYSTAFVGFFVSCLPRRTCQSEVLFLGARVPRRAVEDWRLIVISWAVLGLTVYWLARRRQ